MGLDTIEIHLVIRLIFIARLGISKNQGGYCSIRLIGLRRLVPIKKGKIAGLQRGFAIMQVYEYTRN